jgi:dTMP kinase
MAEWTEHLAGRFIVLDGPDGGGKTTQLNALQDRLESAGQCVVRAVDPGGTPTGQQIRQILLHSKDLDINPTCETLLFMASRAQLLGEVIRPGLDAGAVVLCDRFISATLAYQGALGVDPDRILALGKLAVDDTWPDLTVVLDIDAQRGLDRLDNTATRVKRRSARPGQMALFGDGDRLESRTGEYHERVRAGFARLPDIYPGPVALVDAAGSPDEVTARIIDAIAREFDA